MISNPKVTERTRGSSTSALVMACCALVLWSTGCVTMAGDQLDDIVVRPLQIPPPSIEQTIGDYSFHLDGGKMITSNKAGREVNKLILDRWQKRGLITKETYVKSSQFTGNAEYNLTLAGHQEGDSNVVMQFLSGLTLFLIPYSVNTQFDLIYTLEHVESGNKFEAKAADSFRMITELLLLPVSPFAMGGALRTYNRLADHLYDQLAAQGAFDPAKLASTPANDASVSSDTRDERREATDGRSAVERLQLLDQLREEGVVTDEEYDEKKREILRDL